MSMRTSSESGGQSSNDIVNYHSNQYEEESLSDSEESSTMLKRSSSRDKNESEFVLHSHLEEEEEEEEENDDSDKSIPILQKAFSTRREKQNKYLKLREIEANLFSKQNIAIPLFYLLVGFNTKFPSVALRQYLRNGLKASPADQTLVTTVVMGLPWNIKVLFAFLSDSYPIFGYRRKPYILIGIIICAVSWILFGVLPQPNILLSAGLIFLATLGLIVSDVMIDSMVVEKVLIAERGNHVGEMQTTCFLLRFIGSLVGYILGGILLDPFKFRYQTIFYLTGFIHICVLLPSLIDLRDRFVKEHTQTTFLSHLLSLWDKIQQRNIYQPMIFIYILASTQSSGDAFSNFLLGKLKFTDLEYSVMLSVGLVGSIIGTWIYKMFFREVNLRILIVTVIALSCIISLTPLILIFGWNRKIGLPDFLFAIGDEAVSEATVALVSMPIWIQAAKLCGGGGVEASTYASLTVVNNLGVTASGTISSLLTG